MNSCKISSQCSDFIAFLKESKNKLWKLLKLPDVPRGVDVPVGLLVGLVAGHDGLTVNTSKREFYNSFNYV